MRLNYTITRGWAGEKIPVEYVVQLWSTECRFGGRRWWFECPLTGRRVTKLYLPTGQPGSHLARRTSSPTPRNKQGQQEGL